MSDYIYEDFDGMRVMVSPVQRGFHIMLDNIHQGNPKTHAFAAAVVAPDDIAKFLTDLGEQMGMDVEVRPKRVMPTEAVKVLDNSKEEWYTPGENKYTVMGDVDDFLTDDEAADLASKWEKLNLENGSWSSNYFVADILAQEQGGRSVVTDVEFDPEGMCFFAYTSDEAKAQEIADWINQKKFLA